MESPARVMEEKTGGFRDLAGKEVTETSKNF